MSFKKMANDHIAQRLVESAVGSRGRTGKTDADKYINNNPEVVSDFMAIIRKMGGKAVARRILDRVNIQGKIISEAKEDAESYLRDVGFKIKSVTPGKDGSKEIEFYKESELAEAYDDLMDDGFGEFYKITKSDKTLTIKDK